MYFWKTLIVICFFGCECLCIKWIDHEKNEEILVSPRLKVWPKVYKKEEY